MFFWTLFIHPRLHANVCLDKPHLKISQGHVILHKVDRGGFSILEVNHVLVGQDGARLRDGEKEKIDRGAEKKRQSSSNSNVPSPHTYMHLDSWPFTHWQGLLTGSMGKLPLDV